MSATERRLPTAGGVASLTTPRFSAASGGLLCVAAAGVIWLALPGLTRYPAAVPVSPDLQVLPR